ncbi:MAG: hypothetical protein R3Y13_05640 [bacterium]
MENVLFVLKLKLKCLFNLTLYNGKRSLFKVFFDKIPYERNTSIAPYALFVGSLSKLLFQIIGLMIFVFYPLNFLGIFNVDSLIILSIFLPLSIFLSFPTYLDFYDDKYYALELIRMNKRKFYLSDYLIKLVTNYFAVFFSILILKIVYSYSIFSVLTIFLLTYFFMSMKTITIYINLLFRKTNLIKMFCSILFFVLGYSACCMGVAISTQFSVFLIILFTLTNSLIFYLIFRFKSFDKVYQFEYDNFKRKNIQLKNYERNLYTNDMVNLNINKTKNPYVNYMNIFEKRYKACLPKGINLSFIIVFIFLLISGFLSVNHSKATEVLNANIKGGMPFFVLVLVWLNNSRGILKNLYTKGDVFMESHNFFNTKNVSFNMYKVRSVFLIKRNIPSTVLLCLGLCVIYFITGGTSNNYEYILLCLAPFMIMLTICIYYLSSYYIFSFYENSIEKVSLKSIIFEYLPFYLSFVIVSKETSIAYFTLFSFIILLLVIILSFIGAKCRKGV